MRSKSLMSVVILALSLTSMLYSQNRRAASALPQITVDSYHIQLTLDPDPHEMQVVAAIKFKPVQATDMVVFHISENLSITKVSDEQGGSLDFGQDEPGPGNLAVHFPKALEAGAGVTIKIQYTGGFDLDRYSRNFTRDQSAAYIGMEGSYLLYPARWFPINRMFGDRPAAEVAVTVPLGMTAVGPGAQLPVVTHDVTETFSWSSQKLPAQALSVVAGRYFERKAQFENWTIDTFAREDHIDAMKKAAEALVKPLDYYRQLWGEPAAAKFLKLVEVDDKLALQPGMLGAVFITHKELSDASPPVRMLARRAACQWWMDTAGIQNAADLWLADGMAYYSAAQFMGQSGGSEILRDEIDNLAVLGLKYESKAAIREGISLGYGTDFYQSVVAGKGAYVLNMLQGIMGPEKFMDLVQRYSKQAAGRGGSTAEFQKLAEQVHGKELNWFFREWLDTTGVPNFQIDYVIYKTRDGFRVSGTVKQDNDLFRMPLEIEAQGEGKTERSVVELSGKTTPFDVNTFTWPQKVLVDPDNKLLRDSDELQFKVQVTLGGELKEKGNYVEAVRAYEQAIKINPRKSIAHFRLAEVFFEQMNLSAAANTFRDALNGDKEPKWIEVWCYIYIGKGFDILGQRQRALAEYSKALNTKDNTNGALDEAKKYTAVAYSRDAASPDVVKK